MLASLAACSESDQSVDRIDGDLRITFEQGEAGTWRVSYELANPRPELDLGDDLASYRANNWEVETKGAMLLNRDRRDFLVPIDGRRNVRKVDVVVRPAQADLPKDYLPFVAMRDGGVILYTGHFIAFRDETTRLDARLTIVPAADASVSAFGEIAPRLDDWESPFKHPAFIYIGRTMPVQSDALSTITDATAPDWVRSEIAAFAPAIAAALRSIFARTLPTKPNIFLAMDARGEPGKLGFSGDALPGQYRMTLSGGGWENVSAKAQDILRLSTAHETAHLWQAAARPKNGAVPDWIHEGGADALAAAAMVEARYWTQEQAAEYFAKAKANCARTLDGLSLQRAETERRWDAVYACGHVITMAAAGEGGVASFWREFVKRSAADGYDEAMFLALAEEKAGTATAQAIRDLIRINDARPDRAIARMFGEAPDLAAAGRR